MYEICTIYRYIPSLYVYVRLEETMEYIYRTYHLQYKSLYTYIHTCVCFLSGVTHGRFVYLSSQPGFRARRPIFAITDCE
jgi:uncharacterized membrane protein